MGIDFTLKSVVPDTFAASTDENTFIQAKLGFIKNLYLNMLNRKKNYFFLFYVRNKISCIYCAGI